MSYPEKGTIAFFGLSVFSISVSLFQVALVGILNQAKLRPVRRAGS